mgnify:CR=1 FL=1
MNIPENLKYTKEHEWVRVEEGNVAYVGITDFAQGELGEIVYVEVDTVGDSIDKDGLFGTVEAVKTTSELYMPIKGKVIEFNTKLDENGDDSPEVINSDAFGEGWIIKIEIENMDDLAELLDAEAYQGLVG